MTRFALAAALLGTTAVPALAGALDPTPVEPVIIVEPSPLVDWSGGYVGATIGGTSTDTDVDGTFLSDDDDPAGGLFLGTNFQNGNVVYGGELGIGVIEDTDYTIDARGRIGYAAGRAMPFLSVGYNFTDTGTTELDGPSVGLGVDYLVTDRVFVGGEVRYIDLEGENDGNDVDVDGYAVGLRLGYKF